MEKTFFFFQKNSTSQATLEGTVEQVGQAVGTIAQAQGGLNVEIRILKTIALISNRLFTYTVVGVSPYIQLIKLYQANTLSLFFLQ